MNSFDPTLNGLYYNATQAAQKQLAGEAARRQKTKEAEKTKKPLFGSFVQNSRAENSVQASGLPPEIAGLSQEEALVYLKDSMDLAGDALSESADGAAFERYKKAVGDFVKYIQKNNYQLEEHRRAGRTRQGKKKDPLVLVQAIDQKLEQLCHDIWYNHLDKLNLLKKIHEINGLVVDLSAV